MVNPFFHDTQDWVMGLAFDDAHVYWSAWAPTPDGLGRIPIAGATPGAGSEGPLRRTPHPGSLWRPTGRRCP